VVKAKSVSLTINGKEIRAIEGEKILWVALDNGIYIPNLCAIRERGEPFAACRLCFVELEGKDMPVTEAAPLSNCS
jgi:formate dehydrogenase major subunit/NADH-quinone oxidoreductase subunit G